MGGEEKEAQAFLEPQVKYHPCYTRVLTGVRRSGTRTVLCGQFGWGGLLLKGNGGVQSYFQHGWQSCVERKGRRVVDCETYKSSRCESRT